MSNDTATSTDDTRSHGLTGLGLKVDAFIVTIIVASLALCSIVALMELSAGHGDINWTLFALISALLVVTETTSTTWLRFGDGGVVTPSWTFTFSLILLGSPTGAIAVMAATTVLAEVSASKPLFKVLFNTAQITLSLAIGSFILFAFGIHGPLFVDNSLSTRSAIAMLISGVVVFLTNGVIICRLLATIEHTGFWQMMRESFALSMSADAAMLAMAPILLVSAMNSLLMLPLIGTATFFVYQTARHAILRAYEANHDPLTQLMNRRAFTAELDDFAQSGPAREGAVFILDLDKFKDINDRLGHATGDHVLQQFSARLRHTLGDEFTIARLGGDEFAVLLEDTPPDEAIAIARDLHADLEAPLKVDGFPISAGSSIGVALSPHDGTTPSELLHAADVAMYRAKRFRSGVEVYESFGASKPRGRVTLLADVFGAIERGEFFLEYQPQVELTTGRVTTVEALLRWNHPAHGLIPPAEFIALAEHTDLIGPITDFVVETAIGEVAAIDTALNVSLNVSARNLQDRHFAGRILATIAEAGIDPCRVEIEITESAATIEQDRTDVTIEQLRSAGVRVAIDDFGTGYSSFATLRDLSADRIKIDRSFITNMLRREADATIVRSVIDVAHGLGLDVVAEGVETADVHALLCEWGCDVAQGFFFSRPLPANALPAIVGAPALMHDRPGRADIGLVDLRAAVVAP